MRVGPMVRGVLWLFIFLVLGLLLCEVLGDYLQAHAETCRHVEGRWVYFCCPQECAPGFKSGWYWREGYTACSNEVTS